MNSLISVTTKMLLDVMMPFTTIERHVELVVKGIKALPESSIAQLYEINEN